MATEVEIKSTLTPMTGLTDLSEITNERKSPRTYISPLSDSSNKASKLSNLTSPLIVEEKSRLGSALKLTTTSTPGTRPRLSAKPFKSSDSFEVRKLPITAPKLNSFTHSSLHGKPGQTAADEELCGNVFSVDQKLDDTEIRGSNIFTAQKVFCSIPATNILTSDTTSNLRSNSLSLTQGTEIAEELKPIDLSQTKECQSISQFEVVSMLSMISQKPEGVLHSELSRSSAIRPFPVESHRTGENKGSCMDAKSKDLKKPVTTDATSPTKVQLRTKHRPVSAVFLESLRDSKPENRDISEGMSLDTSDKPWVRKPRPLSVDLTAKFESKFTPLQQKTICASEETKENVPVAHSANRLSLEQCKIMSTGEGLQAKGRSDSFKSNFKSTRQSDNFQLDEQKQETPSKDVNGFSSEITKELLITTLVESSRKWENEKKTHVPVDECELEKNKVSPNDKSKSNKGLMFLDPNEIAPVLTSEKPSTSSQKEETRSPGGSIQRRISLLLAGSSSSPANAEPASAERENRNVDIQKRIKEFTVENVEVRPGSLRKSFTSRPLSADLTKMFSAQTPTNEMKSQNILELHTESPREAQDKQEYTNVKNKEETLYGRKGPSEPLAERIHWNISQSKNLSEKEDQFGRGSFSKEVRNVSLPDRHASNSSNLEQETIHVMPSENVDFRTVRATLLEHNVQWHNAPESLSIMDPSLKLDSKTEKTHESVNSTGPEREPLLRRNLEGKVHLRPKSYKMSDVSKIKKNAGEPEKEIVYNEQSRSYYEAPLENYSSLESLKERTSKYIEDTLKYQRIEPRYEIIQTVGERARSESITLAAEDKAVTLRSRKSSFRAKEKEKRELIENVQHSDWSCSLPDNEIDSFREVTLHLDPKNTPETNTIKSGFIDPRPLSIQSFTLQGDTNEPVKFQTDRYIKLEKTPSFTYTDKQLDITRNEKMTGINNLREKERNKDRQTSHALDKCGKYNVSECLFSDSTAIKTHRTDTLKSGDSLEKQAVSTKVNANRSHISGYEGSQSNDFLTGNQPRTEIIAVDKGESRVFGLKKYQEMSRMRKDVDGTVTKETTESKSRHAELEGKIRRTSGNTTDLSIAEQLRMNSLSEDRHTFEKSKSLVHDNTKSSTRRTHFIHSTEGTVSRENKKCHEDTGSNESSQDASYCPGESMRLQDLILEPKATYFAVTCHLTNKKKDISGSHLNQDSLMILSNQEIPAPSEHSSRKNKQTPEQPSIKSSFIYEKHFSPETNSKKLDERQDWDLPKQYMPSKKTKPGKDYGWRAMDKNLGNVTKNDVGLLNALLKERIASNINTGDNIFLDNEAHVQPSRKKGKEFAQKNPNEHCSFIAEPQDSYRSSVLDIDELMANYKPESLKVSEVQSKQYEHQDKKSSFNKGRSKSLKNYVDKHHSNNWKDQKESLQSSPNFAVDSNKPIDVKSHFSRESNKKVDSFSQDMNKQKSKDTKISYHNWEKLGDTFSAKTFDSPSEAIADQKKNPKITDEEQAIGVPKMKQYNGKNADYGSGFENQAHLKPKSDLILNSLSSKVTADNLLQKALSRKCQLTEKSVESDSQKNINYSSEVLKNKGSAVRTSDGIDVNKSKSSIESSLSKTQSHSGKNRPARVKDIAHLIQEDKEKRREENSKQSFHLESREIGVKKRNSTRRERGSIDDKMDTENEWTRNNVQKSVIREDSAAPLHRRSRSLRERVEPQPVDSCFYDQLKQCFARPSPAAKDTDILVQEADSQYNTWRGEGHEDSYVPVSPSSDNAISTRKQLPSSRLSSLSSQTETDQHDSTKDQRTRSLDRSSTEMDSADSAEKPISASPCPEGDAVDFSFMDQTSVLDSSALKNRVQLSRRSQRRAPASYSQRRSRVLLPDKQLTIMEDSDSTWMFKDSTEEKPETQEVSAEEEKPQKSAVQPQRLPVFPGMDPSVLKAQLRKRQEAESPSDGSGAAKLFKSPKSPLQQGVLGDRPLPSPSEEDRPEETSPQWLKELKSKKRQSQYENQV
ncbi:uncharacterized protein KIAA1671 homolog isoform X2 [Rhinatrema bivittatum]|uniref:uncharacterized protein KIAA1671 homolog isoform X2 n=1 Tax=Rhinatrema bivittatum TaxID=194408 RepID=UPI00112A2CB9|nr:uncharacterized protein KIAA1671 homolog isoform X2 [Rhinatrema bivittatum]